MEKVTLNVSGKKFETFRTTLNKIPDSKLGRLTKDSQEYDYHAKEYFFDRDAQIMNNVLNLYRTGELHVPTSMCGLAVRLELKFWEIPEELISECCWSTYTEHVTQSGILDILDQTLGEKVSSSDSGLTFREKVWLTMEKPFYSVASKVLDLPTPTEGAKALLFFLQ